MAHALLRGTLPSGPHKGVPPSGKHLHNKEFSMQYIIYRSKKKTLAGESKWNTKTKNVFLFNQRQNIKVKLKTAKKTRQESK